MQHRKTISTLLAVAALAAGASPASAEVWYGNASNNSHTGTWGADLLVGYGGHDTLFGSWGDDRLRGDDGNDYLNGGPGNDIVNGGYGNDELAGGGDNVRDVIYCGPGWDIAWVRPYDITYDCERRLRP